MITSYDLAQFTGTITYYKHWLKCFLYTDGIKYLADNGAAWLVDAVASYQPQLISDPALKQCQFWKLIVQPDQTATLICERDTDDIVVKQEIPFTDFPLPEIKLFLIDRVLHLPSEH